MTTYKYILAALMMLTANYSNAIPLKSSSEKTDITLLTAISLDKTQTIKIKAGIISEGGLYGVAEIDGWAAGHTDNSINGTMSLWLSAGQAGNEPGTYEEAALPGWNIMLMLRPGQSPEDTAKALAERINSDTERPYYAVAHCHKVLIYHRTAYEAKGEQNIKDDCEKSALDMPHKVKIISSLAAKNKKDSAKAFLSISLGRNVDFLAEYEGRYAGNSDKIGIKGISSDNFNSIKAGVSFFF